MTGFVNADMSAKESSQTSQGNLTPFMQNLPQEVQQSINEQIAPA
jgi:hypothetical protein